MGVCTIFCPSCQQAHQWFSGNIDQRCLGCKNGAETLQRYNGEPLEGALKDGAVYARGRWHQVLPRLMVDGDIYPPGYLRGYVEVNLPPRYDAKVDTGPTKVSFGEWAKNIRTVKLLERCSRVEKYNDRLASKFQLLEQYHKQRGELVSKLQQEMKVVEDERDAARARAEGWYTEMQKYALKTPQSQRKVDELESELRQSQRLLGAYIKVAGRRYRRIAELETALKNVRLAAGLTTCVPPPIIHSDD